MPMQRLNYSIHHSRGSTPSPGCAMDYTVSRRVNLLRDCKNDGVDGLLVTHATNVRYLTGFTGSSGSLVLSGKHAILISDGRYEEQIKEQCPGLDVHIRPH